MEKFWVPKEHEGSSDLAEAEEGHRESPKEGMSVLGCEEGAGTFAMKVKGYGTEGTSGRVAGLALGQSTMILISLPRPCLVLANRSPLLAGTTPVCLGSNRPHSGTVLVLGRGGTKAEWESESHFPSSPLAAGFGAHGKDLHPLDFQRPRLTTPRSPELPELSRHWPGLVPHGGDELLLVFNLLQDLGQFLL